MTWSRYFTAIRQSFQRSSRTGPIRYVILHHGATTSDEVMIQMMVSGSRQVSATGVVKDNRRTGVIDEDYRPWTSSSARWDGQACTIECANESTNGWTISDASYESMAILLADWSRRYGFPLRRAGVNSTVFGHGELYRWFGDSYATACPGGMDVDRVVNRANQLLSGTAGGDFEPLPAPKKKDIDMLFLRVADDGNGKPYFTVLNTNTNGYAPPVYGNAPAGWAKAFGPAVEYTRPDFIELTNTIKKVTGNSAFIGPKV